MTVSLVVVCESYHLENSSQVCDSTKLVESALLPPHANDQISLLLNGGFSIEAAEIGFLGVMSLWVAGVTVGLIISQIRKLRV